MGGACISGDGRGDSQLDGMPMQQKVKSKQGPQCTETNHLGTQQLCGSGDCKTNICSHCGVIFENVLMCQLCSVVEKNKQARKSGKLEERSSLRLTETMHKTSGLKVDKETGQIEGEWEEVLAGYLHN